MLSYFCFDMFPSSGWMQKNRHNEHSTEAKKNLEPRRPWDLLLVSFFFF